MDATLGVLGVYVFHWSNQPMLARLSNLSLDSVN